MGRKPGPHLGAEVPADGQHQPADVILAPAIESPLPRGLPAEALGIVGQRHAVPCPNFGPRESMRVIRWLFIALGNTVLVTKITVDKSNCDLGTLLRLRGARLEHKWRSVYDTCKYLKFSKLNMINHANKLLNKGAVSSFTEKYPSR